jgi:UDP-N-acetylmuramyl pentapeptide phosphotransferase/UDP-N-acetylglucosamine-1-phosphate transferase
MRAPKSLPPRISSPPVNEVVWSAGVAVAAGLLTCAMTRMLIPVLARREILDHPNDRSSHRVPTPRGGGIAVIVSLLLGWIALGRTGSAPYGVYGLGLGTAFLAIVSWIDDLGGVSPLLRLLAQAVAVAIGVSVLPEPQDYLSLALISLLWIWWINLFNFMDGIDGLAGAEAASIGAGLLLFASVGAGVDTELRGLAAVVSAAAIGFLVWNWAPARIFLGDVGSVPLGFLLGFLLFDLACRGHWKIALILPLYFLADATITLSRRLLRGERVWRAHREHFYQRAVRRGFGHEAVITRVLAANGLLIGCGWAAENGWGGISVAASAVIVAILLWTLGRGP